MIPQNASGNTYIATERNVVFSCTSKELEVFLLPPTPVGSKLSICSTDNNTHFSTRSEYGTFPFLYVFFSLKSANP